MDAWEQPYDLSPVECPHGIPDADWCSICKHGPSTVKADDVERQTTITATFDSSCPSCDDPILAGQATTRWSDDQWRHEGCAP
jgi:hypothetical protein